MNIEDRIWESREWHFKTTGNKPKVLLVGWGETYELLRLPDLHSAPLVNFKYEKKYGHPLGSIFGMIVYETLDKWGIELK